MKTIITLIGLLINTLLFAQQAKINDLTYQEKNDLVDAIENDSIFASWVKDNSNAINLYKQYKSNVQKSDSIWKSDQMSLKEIKDFGYTERFEIIPLVEHLHGNNEFRIGDGVSYLIRTDQSTILFDTGGDDDSTMSAFRYNLDILEIDISEIDAIVITHNHPDHQNMWKWIKDKTFVNKENEYILSNMEIYVPDDTHNLKINTVCSHEPIKISEGVYTTGIIKAPLFFNSIQEQALIFNVKDKGLVLVSGCGHQTIEKLIQRCERISTIPLYGMLGGLHFSIDNDSERYMSFFITGKLPWQPFTLQDVKHKIEFIKRNQIELIGLSTHDSSPKAIETFKAAFTLEYTDLRTGEWIIVQ
jgi:7,8-dihydropterin-6-yl-methyl-4-(beta-D-ribofuranosyl)aminobenzene 5'-phosphate synthase